MAATASSRGPRTGPPTTTTRESKDGRRIEYQLTVIQQPERARACGSGAKSSADRRPVDPPPVVELKIFSMNGGEKEDITFSYSANFFLFATLEVARPMAHGRVQQATAAQQVPVLTGMPVSGMAYLDRPTEAGYFIFPDLSVRHEGMYRLSFNLYEEMREGESESQSEKSRPMTGPGAPDASFDWRMEVKSNEFTVFSAKKFPGLAESTALSRTVAEQGCRVRIRRDVRMRRREGKSGGDFEDVGEADYERRGPVQDLENQHGATSDDRPAYEAEQRRSYQDQYPRSYSTTSPLAANTPAPQPNHLGFIGAPTAQYQAPPQSQFAPPPTSAHAYQQPQTSFATPQYRPQVAPAPAHNAYGYERQYPQPAYPSNPPREQREFEPEYRRPSYVAPQPISSYSSVDTSYTRTVHHAYGQRPDSPPPALAPLKLHGIDTTTSPAAPLSAVKTAAPPLPSPGFPRSQVEQSSYSQYSVPIAVAEPIRDTIRNGKRTFDAVFPVSSVAVTKPLHGGMRPSTPGAEEADDVDDIASKLNMEYKRADGSQQLRRLPPSLDS